MNSIARNRRRTANDPVGHLDPIRVAVRHQVLLVRRRTHVHVAHVVVVVDDVLVVAAQTVAHHDPRGSVEAILQVVAHHTEVGQPHPARLYRARARHSVAFAFLAHLRLYVL